MPEVDNRKFFVIFQPSGRRGYIEEGKTIKEASRKLGVDIEGICGDNATCGKCKVGIMAGYIHKPGQVQSQVNIRLRSVKRTHPEYWRLSLLMNLFGGNDSLLYTRLRDDLGLVYAAWAYQTYKWKAGMLAGYIGCKGDKTADAIRETVKIMKSLHSEIPVERFEQKKSDVLNSFVFNVDTPAELVEVYSRYRMRNEPLDTLERIQEAYMNAGKEDIRLLANRFLDPRRLQIFVVGDEKTSVIKAGGMEMTLKEDLMTLAKELGLPFKEIALR